MIASRRRAPCLVITLAAALACIILLTGSGCASIDPWSEMSRAPASRSAAYEGKFDIKEPDASDEAGLPNELTGKELTLGECIIIALERNPRTAISWQAAMAAAARVGQSKSAYLPGIGFSTGASRSDPVELDEKADAGPRDFFDAVFGVRYLLFDGGERSANLAGAKAELLAANFRHNATLQDVALSVAEAYYDLLASVELRDLAVETVNQRDYHLRIAEARHATGLVAKSDVLKVETEKADADLEFVRAENSLNVARGRLARAMGLHVSTALQIADVSEDGYSMEMPDIELLLDEAAKNRPELKIALAEIEAERSAVKAAQARFWPTVTFDSGAGWAGRTFFPGESQWSFGLGLDAPVFTGFDRTYGLHRARANLDRAVAERSDLLRGIELEVWTAYWQIIESGQAIEAAERFVASAEESARAAEAEYKNGTESIIGLIDAQTARTAARTRLIQARLDRHTAIARFERAVGSSLTETQRVASRKGEAD